MAVARVVAQPIAKSSATNAASEMTASQTPMRPRRPQRELPPEARNRVMLFGWCNRILGRCTPDAKNGRFHPGSTPVDGRTIEARDFGAAWSLLTQVIDTAAAAGGH